MLKDITIGQYYPADSVIHKLDARTKMLATFFYMISLFLFNKFAGFLFAFVFLALAVGLSKVPVRYIFKGLRPVLFLLMFSVILNLFIMQGEVLWEWGNLHITKESLRFSVFVSLRLVFLVTGASLMTLTTTPGQLASALEDLMSPLAKFHVPVHDIAMMMSIALRFIPILTQEMDTITKAQMARGAELERGNIFVRAKKMIPIVIPLFVSASRRAEELAQAMDARCYHAGGTRTRMKPLVYHHRDWVAFGVLFVYMLLLLVVLRMLPVM